MWSKFKAALSSGAEQQKNTLSVNDLRILNGVMERNIEVTEENQSVIVDSLRSIAEVVIWGDQNSGDVFDYFLEKDMVGYFDKVLLQNPGTYVNTQLLQTLVLLFDNIKTPTSIWFLLSNNHMNTIITHEFDFNDEEVLAYYISFLRSLSMRLNKNTIHFFRNEHLANFPLYTEALRFFNHKESMVRVAVRTLTLNVYRAAMTDETTLTLINNAVPYISNLVWVIGQQSLDLDQCLTGTEADYKSRGQVEFYMAEHLDHFHYLNDVLDLNSPSLSKLLIESVLNSLFLPLYARCLADGQPTAPVPAAAAAAASSNSPDAEIHTKTPRTTNQLSAMFLLSHTFLLFDHPALINMLAATLLLGDPRLGLTNNPDDKDDLPRHLEEIADSVLVDVNTSPVYKRPQKFYAAAGIGRDSPQPPEVASAAAELSPEQATASTTAGGGAPAPAQTPEALMANLLTLNAIDGQPIHTPDGASDAAPVVVPIPIFTPPATEGNATVQLPGADANSGAAAAAAPGPVEALAAAAASASASVAVPAAAAFPGDARSSPPSTPPLPELDLTTVGTKFRDNIYGFLACKKDDVMTLMSLLMFYTMMQNRGIYSRILKSAGLVKPAATAVVGEYNHELVSQILGVITTSADLQLRTRLVTLQLSIRMVQDLVMRPHGAADYDDDDGGGGPNICAPRCLLTPEHFDMLKLVRDAVIAQLKEVYLDFTERNPAARESFLDSFEDEFRKLQPVKVPLLMSQSTILLTPTASPVPGVDFNCRLPGNTRERTRKAIQIYMLFRKFYLDLVEQKDTLLPLRQPAVSISPRDSLDLNGSDLIVCNVVSKGRTGQMIQVRRFLMVDRWRLVLIENDNRKQGWGIVRFVADLNNVFVVSQAFHTRSLQISIIQPTSAYSASTKPLTVFSGRFIFDDHIRCVTARQYLDQGRVKLREEKLNQVERMLCIAKPKHPNEGAAAAATASAAAVAAAVPQVVAMPVAALLPAASAASPAPVGVAVGGAAPGGNADDVHAAAAAAAAASKGVVLSG